METELFNAELIRAQYGDGFIPKWGDHDPEETRKLTHVIESGANPLFEQTVQSCFDIGAVTVLASVVDFHDGEPAEVTLFVSFDGDRFERVTCIDPEGAYSKL